MIGKIYKELSRVLVKALPPRPPKALFEKYQVSHSEINLNSDRINWEVA
jgi:hypothetical protein